MHAKGKRMSVTRGSDSDPAMQVHVISSRLTWFDVDIGGIWRYRDLVWLLIRRDFVAKYKQTALGPLWFVLQPLLNAIVFSIIFGHVAKLPTDGVPPFLFYLAGTVAWGYFASCVSATANTFVANAGLYGKVFFPRLVMPVSTVISNLVTVAIQYLMLLAFLAWFATQGSGVRPGWLMLLTPLLFLHMGVLGMAVGLLVASVTTRYRDLLLATGYALSLWMYATPIVYPLSQVPGEWRWLFMLNPMTAVIEVFRMAHLGAGALGVGEYALSVVLAALGLAAGLVVFNRYSKSFVDTV